MIAQIFLAAFCGCALAFAFAIVAVWQIGSRAFRKILQGHQAHALASLAQTGAAEMRAEAEANASADRAPVRMVVAKCEACGASQMIPDHEVALAMLDDAKWKIIDDCLVCASCATSIAFSSANKVGVREYHEARRRRTSS